LAYLFCTGENFISEKLNGSGSSISTRGPERERGREGGRKGGMDKGDMAGIGRR
jgi:hypothetical protein